MPLPLYLPLSFLLYLPLPLYLPLSFLLYLPLPLYLPLSFLFSVYTLAPASAIDFSHVSSSTPISASVFPPVSAYAPEFQSAFFGKQFTLFFYQIFRAMPNVCKKIAVKPKTSGFSYFIQKIIRKVFSVMCIFFFNYHEVCKRLISHYMYNSK